MSNPHNPDLTPNLPYEPMLARLPYEQFTTKELCLISVCLGVVIAIIIFAIAAHFEPNIRTQQLQKMTCDGSVTMSEGEAICWGHVK